MHVVNAAARKLIVDGGYGPDFPFVDVITPAPPQADRPVSTESLGSQVIERVDVEGQKITWTLPVGMTSNDRPSVSVTESWFSPELRITVLAKHSDPDPRMGEFVEQLRNIERSEPDPALFRVPPDYQVVDENDHFEIKIVGLDTQGSATTKLYRVVPR